MALVEAYRLDELEDQCDEEEAMVAYAKHVTDSAGEVTK